MLIQMISSSIILGVMPFLFGSGDHTVKIIDCQTGSCLRVLIGHRRTPWVVSLYDNTFLSSFFLLEYLI